MTKPRRDMSIALSLRGIGLALLASTAAALPVPAQSLLPPDLFIAPFTPGPTTDVDANTLIVNAETDEIIAEGDVAVVFGAYRVFGDRLVYNRTTREARVTGSVRIVDPAGSVIESDDLILTDEQTRAILERLVLTAYDGSQITAESVDLDREVASILENARYAPCGVCIDAQGRRIGWSVRAMRFVQNADDNSVELFEPVLEILGIPVAWLPYLWLPDASQSGLDRIGRPTYAFDEQIGHRVEVPILVYSSPWTDVVLSPTLVSRQGLLVGGEVTQRFTGGSARVRATGIYQLDPAAFRGEVGDRQWRGAIQSAISFRPTAEWLVGASYTAFSDAAFLEDYLLAVGESSVNQVYATYLREQRYFDARVQQFLRLGNVTETQQAQFGAAVPNLRYDETIALGDGRGRLELTGRLLGVTRGSDQVGVLTTPRVGPRVRDIEGFAGNKVHGTFQAAWTDQYIVPGGVALRPYLGARLDAASFDPTGSVSPLAPDAQSRFGATPIAAIDMRWPLAAHDAFGGVHVAEPIAQLVYRGSGETLPGIVNDDAQSFALDDTNIFSFDRFSGYDRQETGLRANLGGRYTVEFADGANIDLVAGQSFHLAGVNAFGVTDVSQRGATGALEADLSHAMLGAYAAFSPFLNASGKVLIDPEDFEVTRGGASVGVTFDVYRLGLDYFYEAPDLPAGQTITRHEIAARAGVTIFDYYSLDAGVAWDIDAQTWLQASGGIGYSDGFLHAGVSATATGPTHRSPNDLRVTANFRLTAPAGFEAGLGGNIFER